jgi:Leucine-rich repeat (LRR) protein
MSAAAAPPPIKRDTAPAVNWGRRIYFAMLGLIALLAIYPAYNHFRIGRYEALRQEIQSAGGRAPRARNVTRSEEDVYWAALGGDLTNVVIRKVDFPPGGSVPKSTLVRLIHFPEIEQLHLDGHLPDRETCREIFGMSNLRRLRICFCELDDGLLEGIDQMQSLQSLSLKGTDISDAAVERLARLSALTELDLRYTHVSQAGLARLSRAIPDASIRHAPWPSPAHSQAARLLFRRGAQLDIVDGPAPGVVIRLPRSGWKGSVGELGAIAQLSDLMSLQLNDLDLQRELMGSVARLPNVRTLTIANCRLREADLAALRASRDLRKVILVDAFVEPPAVEKLASIGELHSLVLVNSRIVPGSLAAMSRLSALRELSLVGTRFRGTVMSELAAATSLRKLDLISMPMGDVQIEQVCQLRELQGLSIQGTVATDDSVPHLSQLVHLRRLDISGTPITPEGVKRLQAALPDCVIQRETPQLQPLEFVRSLEREAVK